MHAAGNLSALLRPAVLGALLAFVAVTPALAAEDLAELIRNGHRTEALAALHAGAEVNAPQPDGSTALLWAVYGVDRELVAELLKRGAKPDVRNALGASPLSEAVNVADVGLVKALLKAGADANFANADNQTPLMLAARTGSLPVAEALVKAGARVNEREKVRNQTALMWAVGANAPEVAAFLIRRKADIEARATVNDWGNQMTSEPRSQYRASGGLTVLHYAARSGCLDCVKALAKAGVDLNRATPDGVTPLMIAIESRQVDVANFLLDAGADPHLADWWGRTALYVAVDSRAPRAAMPTVDPPMGGSTPPFPDWPLPLARRLLEMGVNPNTQLNMLRPGPGGAGARFTDANLDSGASVLLRAAVSHDREAVALLLEHGALVDLPNARGVTPLMAAAGMGLARRDARGPIGGDAEDRAIAVLELLVRAGADVNARVTDAHSHTASNPRAGARRSQEGTTALFGAVTWGWPRVAKFLIDHGARLDIANGEGKTVADLLGPGISGGGSSPEMAKLIKGDAGGT